MSVHAYYEEDDRQLMVGCCDGAHEVLYPLDDPEAVRKLLAALAEAGVLDVEQRIEHVQLVPDGTQTQRAHTTRYVSPWKEAK